jgi:hypothetical protein
VLVSVVEFAKWMELDAKDLGRSILRGDLGGNVDLHDCDTFSRALIETDSVLQFYRTKRDGGILSVDDFKIFQDKFLATLKQLG